MYICILLYLVCDIVAEYNSGVTAIVKSTGNHGCENLIGVQIVLDEAGRNFAAGMIHDKFNYY